MAARAARLEDENRNLCEDRERWKKLASLSQEEALNCRHEQLVLKEKLVREQELLKKLVEENDEAKRVHAREKTEWEAQKRKDKAEWEAQRQRDRAEWETQQQQHKVTWEAQQRKDKADWETRQRQSKAEWEAQKQRDKAEYEKMHQEVKRVAAEKQNELQKELEKERRERKRLEGQQRRPIFPFKPRPVPSGFSNGNLPSSSNADNVSVRGTPPALSANVAPRHSSPADTLVQAVIKRGPYTPPPPSKRAPPFQQVLLKAQTTSQRISSVQKTPSQTAPAGSASKRMIIETFEDLESVLTSSDEDIPPKRQKVQHTA